MHIHHECMTFYRSIVRSPFYIRRIYAFVLDNLPLFTVTVVAGLATVCYGVSLYFNAGARQNGATGIYYYVLNVAIY